MKTYDDAIKRHQKEVYDLLTGEAKLFADFIGEYGNWHIAKSADDLYGGYYARVELGDAILDLGSIIIFTLDDGMAVVMEGRCANGGKVSDSIKGIEYGEDGSCIVHCWDYDYEVAIEVEMIDCKPYAVPYVYRLK